MRNPVGYILDLAPRKAREGHTKRPRTHHLGPDLSWSRKEKRKEEKKYPPLSNILEVGYLPGLSSLHKGRGTTVMT